MSLTRTYVGNESYVQSEVMHSLSCVEGNIGTGRLYKATFRNNGQLEGAIEFTLNGKEMKKTAQAEDFALVMGDVLWLLNNARQIEDAPKLHSLYHAIESAYSEIAYPTHDPEQVSTTYLI